MYPNTTADSLRLRYRQPVAYQSPRRAARPDVVTRPQPRPAQPIQRVTQQPQATPALASLPAAAPPKAEPADHFRLNLHDVPAAPVKRSRYLVKPHRGLQYTVVAMSVALFVLGGYVSFTGFKSNQAVAQVINQEPSTEEQAAPAVTAPSEDDINDYQVAADMPRFITIDSLGVKARVKSLGAKANGQITSPSNVHDAGWYNGSAKPGTPGAALLDGHVSSWTTNGVFYNLKKLTSGDAVSIERGDGSKLTYRVIKTEIANTEALNMANVLKPAPGVKEGLNLITCTGKVKPGTSEFEQRLVVYTERVN
jgi:LPXTG-site transpeptidase (sortase) family protein